MNIVNKKVNFNYILFDKYEAGIALLGGEVKAIRGGHANLSNSHVKVMEDELFLINADIPVEGKKNYNQARIRKLLLHKSEIVSIKTKIKAKKLTIVPTRLYTKKRLIKIEIALAKSKLKHQKKESIKKHDIEREIEREFRGEKDKNRI
ncbi:SsrA-binding protein [Candidatus Woesebacteria bacterium]|nr:MAG: SsrA-binding protein [Candidatus Woesebacteria bacterium]